MRKLIACFLVVVFFISGMPAFAAQGGQKGASPRAYERASDEAVFHRIGDWFATRNKSEEEKKAILAERKAKRKAERMQEKLEKRRRLMEKQMKERQKMMQKQTMGMMKGQKKK